ncbi:hypothetical protein [Caulobacter hibisci]|uniref:Glycosyltransferase RgtA/B/C/D-like domain-containing protein n=1 Tax=Caulobacter hibisci TaxID=2035993 RepID=A0ABS0T3L7_9CAUL|nr:hypothetical protein [Caulobacter hibisci]MBI1685432.1 hypothetical protein [Caulobacter hibisci]
MELPRLAPGHLARRGRPCRERCGRSRRAAGRGEPRLTSSPSPDRRAWILAGGLLLAAAFAIRAWQFGNPLIHVDENFYLLVGDRMLHGALPYVDIWDRKPVGLFVLYAAIRLLGGDGIVQYQVVATLFAAGTALLIARLAAPAAGIVAATAAGLVYLLALPLAGGWGGQAPVFYNLLLVGAALAAFKALRSDDARSVRRLGCLAMLLVGLGLQLKYTVVFEGFAFGVLLLGVSWRVSKSWTRLALDAALWIGMALMPTVLALVFYAWRGETEAFVYANFLSIGARSGASEAELAWRLLKACRLLVPPLIGVGLAAWIGGWRARPGGKLAFGFAVAWLAAAIGGYLAFGTFFDHYALPLLAPLAVAMAPLFAARPRRLGVILATGLIAVMGIADGVAYVRGQAKRGGAAQMSELLAAIRPGLSQGLWVWNGDSILYHLTGAPMPSRWPFAGHLNLLREHGAIGVDQETEVRRILATKPGVIVDRTPRARDFNFAVVRIIDAELAAHYRVVKTVKLSKSSLVVYQRAD